LAVIPEYESDPPHCKATFSSDTGIGVLLILLIVVSSFIILSLTLFIISLVPPSS
jgi:hypothetical protein